MIGSRVAAAVLVAGLFTGSAAGAQDWPNRPVRIVNTFAAGSAADALGRMVAEHLTQVFKQQFFVESRAGGGGVIAIKTVLNAPADGYNLVLTNSGQLVVSPLANPKIAYDPMRDLIHVGMIAGSPVAFLTSPSKGMKSIADLVALAKKSENPLSYSWTGIGTNGQFLVEAFAHQAGIKFRHVPYKGAAQGLMDTVAGHVDFSAATVGSALGQIQSGALLALAHTGRERLPDHPQIPTMRELGYTDLVSQTWSSISAPAALPPSIAERLNREIRAAVESPENRATLLRQAMVPMPMSIDEIREHITAEIKQWKPTVERIIVDTK